jgi:predicted RND superfamily exporter protein
MNATHIYMIDSSMSTKDVVQLIDEVNSVDGVEATIGLEAILGAGFPKEMLPSDLLSVVQNDEYELLMISSAYAVASDEVNAQCDELQAILDKYDSKGMLIGEAPCTKDLINITNEDFKRVSAVSILAIFAIILVVFKSISLPIILVAVIEFAIFINMGIPAYTGSVLPFIASIVIGTIQLGATVDYAILMTNKYKLGRYNGLEKKEAITQALEGSIQSIIVSALSFFSATFGVGLYSNIDMISSLCILMSRGAIISMFVVIFILPSMFMIFDKAIVKSSVGFRNKNI